MIGSTPPPPPGSDSCRRKKVGNCHFESNHPTCSCSRSSSSLIHSSSFFYFCHHHKYHQFPLLPNLFHLIYQLPFFLFFFSLRSYLSSSLSLSFFMFRAKSPLMEFPLFHLSLGTIFSVIHFPNNSPASNRASFWRDTKMSISTFANQHEVKLWHLNRGSICEPWPRGQEFITSNIKTVDPRFESNQARDRKCFR